MIRGGLRKLHQDQRGLTAVEMIITMALTGIIIAAIFSVYMLLYRVQTTWQDKSQARAIGLIAEQSLQRDMERYQLTPNQPSPVELTAATTGPNRAGFKVTYSIASNRLVRTVTRPGSSPSSSIVAHGILEFKAWCSSRDPAPSQPPGAGVWVDPPLTVTPRNDPGCGVLSVAMRVDAQ